MSAIIFEMEKGSLDAPAITNMKRITIYWISQVSGWSLFLLVNIAAIGFFSSLTWQHSLLLAVYAGTGLLLTHLYRLHVKKQNWLNLPFRKIVPLVLIASFVIGSLMYGLFFSLNQFFDVYEPRTSSTAGSITIGILNTSSIVFLWSLIYFSVHLFENYKRAEIESYIWEAAVKDFELKTLKSQLNPHFMFNAMNSIRALIEEDPESAKNALTRLSGILRYSLKIERSETVPLEEEIQTVKDYLALEEIRFEERLKYKLDIDPKSIKVEIPPMMIQTLVENGIKHGISKRMDGGIITVETMLNSSKLYICISNSGHLDDQAMKLSQGFGINNTRHRLSLIYGEKSSFKLFNKNTELVSAEIIIPTGGINK
jgi:two-component system, LytTR family, sensor kinase